VGGDDDYVGSSLWEHKAPPAVRKRPADIFGAPLSDSVDRSAPPAHLFGDRAPGGPRCTKGFNLGFTDVGPWAPELLPFARALRMPALTRSTIQLRSSSATAGPKREHCVG
jgi:hypothetical protein